MTDAHAPVPGVRPVTSVLFATIAAGGGHVATANAMAEALHELEPGGVSTDVLDVMAEFGFEELDRRHKESWRAMLRRPRLVRLGQRLTDVAPGLTRAAQNALLDDFARAAQRRVDELGPDLVVANHGWLATALTRARLKYGMRSKVAVYATEPFDASALWAEPQAEHVMAPSLAAKSDLVRLGVPEGRVAVLGYPVRQAFLKPPSKEAARQEAGLDGSFTCLLSLGAEGMATEALGLAEALAARGIQVVAVAGRNRELLAGLQRLAEDHPRLHAVGFTDRMPTFLAAADLVVGKAGPASTMEALAVGRPLLATSYAGLNEERVVRFLQVRHLGGHAPTIPALLEQVDGWRDEGRRERARVKAAELDFPGMSERLARHIRTLALRRPASGPSVAETAARAFEGTRAKSLTGKPKDHGRVGAS